MRTSLSTTSRGIGPAYEDKIGRRGIRVCDLLGDREALAQEVRENVSARNRMIKDSTLDWKPVFDQVVAAGERRLAGDLGVHPWPPADHADHLWDQGRELLAYVVADVVVDRAGHHGEQRMRAPGVVGPLLAGEEGRHLHEAGAFAGVSVTSRGQQRHHVWGAVGHGDQLPDEGE